MRPDARTWLAAALAALLLVGCGGDADDLADPGDDPSPHEPDDAGRDDQADSQVGPGPEGGAADGSTGDRDPAELPRIDGFPQTQIVLTGPDGDRIDMAVHVAADGSSRSRGLMEVEDLPEDAGMLFVFLAERRGGFYMFNTVLPLSIAFFDDDGELLEILDMDPCPSEVAGDCEIYDPGVAYRSALEVHQGYFAERGIEPGWRIDHDDIPAS